MAYFEHLVSYMILHTHRPAILILQWPLFNHCEKQM